MEIAEIMEIILAVNAIAVVFLSILWTLGTRDRRNILKRLHEAIHLLQDMSGFSANHEDENTKKGGEGL